MQGFTRFGAVVFCAMFLAAGCGDSQDAPQPAGADASAPAKVEGGYASGRVLGQDGKSIAVADDISITLYGVSEAGEKVNYSPGVKPDGTWRQKLVPGSYRFGTMAASVTVKHGPQAFRFNLVPQGNLWNKDRDAKDGIEQDFVWKVTGPRTDGPPDPNNHTHWHGMNVGMRFAGYREDTKKPAVPPPAGTTLVFTVKPLSKCIDGRDLQPVTIERPWQPDKTTPNDDLNDLPPADYEITGVAKLPDGTTKPIVFQGRGDYPNFKPSVKAPLELDGIIGGMAKHLVSWGID